MLIIAILRYVNKIYVNTFKARNQTPVNKHNPTCGMCHCGMCCLIPIAIDMSKKILRGSRYDKPLFIYSRFVGMTIYFPLMYRYGINTNILHLTFFRAELQMSIITGISNETTNELTIYAILCQNVTIFYRQELASLFQVHEK